jgi:hypothetical protein
MHTLDQTHGYVDTFRLTKFCTNVCTQEQMHKRVLARKDSVASGNLDRGNGASTLQRVST